MKKLAALLCLSALATGAFAQGTVAFANGPTTLISSTPNGGSAATLTAAPVGSYIYGLLIGTSVNGPFTFAAGAYATNTAAGSKLGPGTYQPAITGWAAQTTMFFEVAGWSANLGFAWNPGWVNGTGTAATPKGAAIWGSPAAPEWFGLSNVGTGTSGGGQTPPLPVFGGTGVSGFSLLQVAPVPEPSTMALAGLGAAALLIFRRRK
jgi:hypothetical protein